MVPREYRDESGGVERRAVYEGFGVEQGTAGCAACGGAEGDE